MIRLRAEHAEELGEVGRVREALGLAVRLELAVIPPYLYALWTLRPGANEPIARLLRSIVIEEMSHMALASNVLVALGGRPAFAAADLVPRYPGPLPGAVEASVTVGLRPFSKQLVREVFMVIEQPDSEADAAPSGHISIGDFYGRIREAVGALPRNAFSGDGLGQAGWPWIPTGASATDSPRPEVPVVHDPASAMAAIDLIVEQGEGSARSPFDREGELSHYHRLREIADGRRISAEPPYQCTGEPVVFDPSGVAPAVRDPVLTDYAAGSRARRACAIFNADWAALLAVLEASLARDPSRLPETVRLMQSLKLQALALMAIDVGGGRVAGPSFEPPV